MKQFVTIVLLIFCVVQMNAQIDEQVSEPKKVFETFKDTRVINTHSVETLKKKKLDVRIGHRFGDMGDGWETFWGLENSTDVLIGADYGVTDKLTIGLGRTKGGGPLKALISGTAKYKIFEQVERGGSPFTVTALAISTASTMKKSDDPVQLNYFDKTAHRFSFAVQLLIAKKFGERFSLQLIPGYVHRNIVLFEDENDMLTAGFAARYQLTKVIGLIVDYTIPLSAYRSETENGYYHPFGIGIEFDTGGHVFQMNLTNATAIMETDYIPNTQSSWTDGQFRMGFTISRLFNL